GTAGCTIYQILATKIAHRQQFILVDGGMADNPRPLMYGAEYTCDPLGGRMGNRGSAPVGAETRWTIAGKACEEGDVLIRDAVLPFPTDDRRLVVWTTGAYCFSMSSNYNRLLRPAMILVREGQAAVVREREDYADLLALDRLPTFRDLGCP
ncbi:MAG: diaminopimelate decarboxylase, partial [Cyanobacteria bacterium REEB65]|nr:diaminopimelate decarboxylase [Cyanobacteria bacterium REEB65]